MKRLYKQPALTQTNIDIREIECALDLFKRGRSVIWSCVREAVDRLEAEQRKTDGQTEDGK